MPIEMSKAYEPDKYEDEIYEKWEISGFFNPDNLDLAPDARPYTIVLPPPNITDKLHIGHAAMLAIEDLMIRYHRMKGDRALWVPGTDHAAIATQNVVEKKLLKEEGVSRHDLGREKFLQRIWQFLRETQATILNQTRKMGASLDWSREAFTLDEKRERAVKKMFVDMYDAGAIYRGERIVNWCPRCNSTLADDEVEYKEQKAMFYTFKYANALPIAIATTRPETKLGDTAVAVNPKDGRYADYIGKVFAIEFCGAPLKIKIIADHNVDMEFGTGALGVTPAHSMADWQMAEKNNLEIIKVISEKGMIRDGFGEYSGLTAIEAREKIVSYLKKNNLIEKEEEIENNLSICYRCGTPIEPLPSKQWFVAVDKKLDRLGGKSMKEKAIEAAENGEIKFIPERFSKRYLDWMRNMHDWCISRQIWFGHRIPVWYRSQMATNGEQIATNNKLQIATNSEQMAAKDIYVGVNPLAGSEWVQDEDSLDTWFSSGMWTFSTLGWPSSAKATAGKPEKTGDLARFHPTQMLETGYEILTLWVSRMIMMSFFAVGEIPFEKVYLHGMVLDKNGKKMSKSKGNGIDPLEMIARFGTDATRLSLLIGNTPGSDMRFSEEKIEGQRNLVNKIWNISRYIIGNRELEICNQESGIGNLELGKAGKTEADKWILGKFNNLIKSVTDDLDNYQFSQAGEKLKEFTRDDLADWYLEAIKFDKSAETEKIVNMVLRDLLKLWHPFIPFVTEAIWKEMGNENFLMIERWPAFAKATAGKPSNDNFDLIIEIIKAIRNARAENKIEPAKKIKAVIYAGENIKFIESQAVLIKSLRTGIEELEIKESGEKIEDTIYVMAGGMDIYLLGGRDEEKEKKRIEEEIKNLENIILRSKSLLDSEDFVQRAPAPIILKEQEKLRNAEEKLNNLTIWKTSF
jgi:valyl-tRNA synthetase